jgi:hypothetical protein
MNKDDVNVMPSTDSVMELARAYAVAYASWDDRASNVTYAALKTAVSETENEIVRLRSALTELTALVRGECGALLDEDRGGSASLSMEIDDLLGPNAKWTA